MLAQGQLLALSQIAGNVCEFCGVLLAWQQILAKLHHIS
jgi:hypothetical protein